jgi:crotonobetainyl-CoA:carnitine CoA-transferase CaiB-like acyl-CoA transferase
MDETPASGLRPAPGLDADGKALRARAARARPQAAAPRAAPDGAPLDGVTVLELGTWFAAPYGATLLADLGARVVKLEQLDGDPIRKVIPFPEVAGVKALMGKESVAVDVAADAGREIVYALARRAQLVLRSFRAGVAERLGLDAKSLLAVNPDLVYLDAPGYGVDGPCGHRPAFAPTIAAGSGLSTRIVGPLVPEHADLSLADVKVGSMRLIGGGAFIAQSDGFAAHGVGTALLLGLVARQRGAPGQRLFTTMLSTVAHALSEDMVRWSGRPPAPESDPELFGFHALYRLYAAAEGFVFLAVTHEREWRRLVAEAPFVALANDPRFRDEAGRRAHGAALAAKLGDVFAARTAADWERALTAADVACVVSAEGPVEASVTDPDGLARALGLVLEVEHPTLEKHPRLVPAVRFSRSRGVAGAGPSVGQHTDLVLRELGYDEARIAELRAQGVIGG